VRQRRTPPLVSSFGWLVGVNCLNRQLGLYLLSSPNIHPAKLCFVYYDFNNVFSSYQPCQFVKNRQVSRTVSPSSGQWCNCGSRLSHITTPNRQCSTVNANHVGVSGRSQVLNSTFRIGVSLYCFSTFVTRHQDRLSVKRLSLLKLLEWSLISIFSLTRGRYVLLLYQGWRCCWSLCPVANLYSATEIFPCGHKHGDRQAKWFLHQVEEAISQGYPIPVGPPSLAGVACLSMTVCSSTSSPSVLWWTTHVRCGGPLPATTFRKLNFYNPSSHCD
jgi:hypothetical protein